MKKKENKQTIPIRESDITKAILDYLATRVDVLAWKQWQGPMSQEGLADISGIIKVPIEATSTEGEDYSFEIGQRLEIEVKRPGGKPTPAQQRFIDNINDMGGFAFVAHSLDECIEKLEE